MPRLRVLSFLAAAAVLASAATPPRTPVRLYGYHAYWMGDAWRSVAGDLDGLYYFEQQITADGTVNAHPEARLTWPMFAQSARATGRTAATTLTLFSKADFEALFTSPTATARLLSQVTELARLGDGVCLDVELFEAVSPAARSGYADFAQRLRGRLPRGARLSIFLPANDWADAFDEARLAAASDYVVVQGYDLHWASGPNAGPVAPTRGGDTNWDAILARYDAFGVARGKVLMGTPLYGYEWPTETDAPGAKTRGPGHTITLAPIAASILPDIRTDAQGQSARYGLRRDPVSRSPYYVYRDSTGGYRQGWFEDAESIAEKVRYARQNGLGGLVFFPLGYDDGNLVRAARRG